MMSAGSWLYHGGHWIHSHVHSGKQLQTESLTWFRVNLRVLAPRKKKKTATKTFYFFPFFFFLLPIGTQLSQASGMTVEKTKYSTEEEIPIFSGPVHPVIHSNLSCNKLNLKQWSSHIRFGVTTKWWWACWRLYSKEKMTATEGN